MPELVIIGYPEATLVHDLTHMAESQGYEISTILPEDLLSGDFEKSKHYLICVTRDLDLRKRLGQFLDDNDLKRQTFIHSSCWVDPSAEIGAGTFMSPFCTVGSDALVDKDTIIGPYTLVSHRVQIGKGTIIHPGSMIAGSTKIGDYCEIRMRASFIDHVHVCDHVTIGAGAMVTKNIEHPGTYVGSPARKISST